MRHRHHSFAQLVTLLAAMAVGTTAAGFSPSSPVLDPVLALGGLPVAPTTEASAPVATACNLGIALGAPSVGHLIDRYVVSDNTAPYRRHDGLRRCHPLGSARDGVTWRETRRYILKVTRG